MVRNGVCEMEHETMCMRLEEFNERGCVRLRDKRFVRLRDVACDP